MSRTARSRLSRWTDLSKRRWWTEVALVAGIYFAYEWTSNLAAGARSAAFAHARAEIAAERWLGLYHERAIQHLFMADRWVIKASDVYYVTIHFIMPIVTLVWLFFRARPHYRRWRNALAWTTGISLVWFVLDPVMPPRLLPASYGFVDTLNVVGGAGRFDAALMKNAGNLYAAMPSLHLAWAGWCACALVPLVRRRWVKALVVADVVITIFIVTVTANHFFLDLLGGAVVLGLGIALASLRWTTVTAWLAALVRRAPWPSGQRLAHSVPNGVAEVTGDSSAGRQGDASAGSLPPEWVPARTPDPSGGGP